MSATYTFESGDEGFSLTGVGTVPYTFDNWSTPTQGQSDAYYFELIGVIEYEIVQSINAYSTMKIRESTRDVVNPLRYNERRKLVQVSLTDEVYSTKRFQGEIRK